MIWGLEGRHSWDGGAAVLNLLKDDAGARVLPRCKLTRIGGLGSLGDSEDVRELAVGREGEVPRRSFRRGKTITYEFDVQATSLDELREYESDLRAAFDDQRTEKVMTVTPHPLYDGSGASRFFRARSLACDVGDEQQPIRKTFQRLYERAGIISVRLSDRRYYDGEEKTDTSLAITNGNDTDTAVCANAGKAATDPVITVTSSKVVTSWAPVLLGGLVMSGANQLETPSRVGNTLTWEDALQSLWIDGVRVDNLRLAPGTRFLYFDPAGGSDPLYGIYSVDSAVSGAPFSLVATRVADADATAEFAQHKVVSVSQGAINGGRTFEQATAATITVNTTAITFALPSATPQGVKVSNETLDGAPALIFPTLSMLSGDSLVIDFRTRRITLNGADTPNLLSTKDWWDSGVPGLAPGNNTIKLATPGGSGSVTVNLAAEVEWHDAYV